MNTKREHVLLQHSTRKPYTEQPKMPNGATFDKHKGYWIANDLSPLVSLYSDYGVRATKKCDQETGEDQKGE